MHQERSIRKFEIDSFLVKYICLFSDLSLFLCFLLSIICVYLCVVKGVKTSGRIAIYTGSLPYIILLILIIRGLFLPGSFDGLYYLIKPDFSKLWNF